MHTMASRQPEPQAACTEWLLPLGVIVIFLLIEAHVQAPSEAAGESLPDPEWAELGVCATCVRGDLKQMMPRCPALRKLLLTRVCMSEHLCRNVFFFAPWPGPCGTTHSGVHQRLLGKLCYAVLWLLGLGSSLVCPDETAWLTHCFC